MASNPLINFLASPWAIAPEKLLELQAIYSAHLRGESADLSAIEARLGRPLANDKQSYSMRDGTAVAVLEIAGVIAHKANMFTEISGGAAASLLEQQVQSMRVDPKVRAVVIDIDSPGGNVLGIPALAAAIKSLASEKPTVAVCTGTMASAAYWLGSAANAVYISGLTDVVGSIGVIATHTFDPRKSAVQTTEITAGRYKRMASDLAPLSAEGRDYLQGQVDQIYEVFVDAVAEHRSVSASEVVENMADGRVFIGQQAIDRGLVDGIFTVDQMVARLDATPQMFIQRQRAKFAVEQLPAPVAAAAIQGFEATTTTPTEGVSMTPKEQADKFAAECPEAVAELRLQAASAECARIQAVMAQDYPGHTALVKQLAFDGKTTGPEAAMAVLGAERTANKGRASDILEDRLAPVGAAASATAEDTPAAAAVTVVTPIAQAHAMRDAIAQKQATAAAAGRTLSAVQALAIIKQEQANG